MSLFHPNSRLNSELYGYPVTTSVRGRPIPIAFGTMRISPLMIWMNGFIADPTTSKTKSTKSGGNSYDYRTAAMMVLCQGPVTGVNELWQNNVWYDVSTSSQQVVIPSSANVTVLFGSQSLYDLGVSYVNAYIQQAKDFGNDSSPVLLVGTQFVGLQFTTGTPGPGQYALSGSIPGNYIFNAADIGKTVQIGYNWNQASSTHGQKPLGIIGYAVIIGEQGQAPWTYLVSAYPQQALGYSECALLVAENFDLGTSGTAPNLQVETYALGIWPGTGQYGPIVDAPIFVPPLPPGVNGPGTASNGIVYSLLSDPLFGAGLLTSDIGDLTDVGNYCVANGLFISPVYDEQKSGRSSIQDLVKANNSEAFSSEGVVKFRSYGDTTTVGNGVTFRPGMVYGGPNANMTYGSTTLYVPGATFTQAYLSPDVVILGAGYYTLGSASGNGDLLATIVSVIDDTHVTLNVACANTAGVTSVTWYWQFPGPIYDLDFDDFMVDKEGDDGYEIERPTVRDAYNRIQIEWKNRGNAYNVETLYEDDLNAIQMYGLRPAPPLGFHFVTTQAVAQQIANVELKRAVNIRNKHKFMISSIVYARLEPMDLVTVSVPELGLLYTPVRILSMEEDDKLRWVIEAEDFPWGTAGPTLNPKQVTGSFGPGIYSVPGPVNTPIFWEPVAQQGGETVTYLRGRNSPLSAPRKSSAASIQSTTYTLDIGLSGAINWGGADVYVSEDGTTYNPVGTQTGPATMGVLTADLPDGTDPDVTNTLSVDLTESFGSLDNPSATQYAALKTLCLVDQELIAFSNANPTAAFAYDLGKSSAYSSGQLRRGVFGTPIQYHKAGASFLFFTTVGIFTYQFDSRDVGQTRWFKFASFNQSGQQQEALSAVTAYPYQLRNPSAPYTWNPFFGFVSNLYPNDPVTNYSSFSIQQQYKTLTDGSVLAQFLLGGYPPNNTFSRKTIPPVIVFVSQSTTGGNLPGATTFLVAVTAIGSDGLETTMSDIVQVSVPSGTSTNMIAFSVAFANAGDTGRIYVAQNDETHGFVLNSPISSGATSFTVTGYLTFGYPAPDPKFDHFDVVAYNEIHGGIWGGPVDVVGSFTLEFIGGTWAASGAQSPVGRYITLISKASNGSIPWFTAQITAVVGGGATLTLSQDPVAAGIQPGDCFVIRSVPTSSTLTVITDTAWANGGPGQAGTGLTPNAEIGNIFAVIGGTGAGQQVPISGNTNDSITLATALTTALDATSICAVLGATPIPQNLPAQINTNNIPTNFLATVENTTGGTWFVQVLTADSNDNQSYGPAAPFREIYQPGAAGTPTTITASRTQAVGDRIVRIDATSGNVVYTLLPMTQTGNQSLVIMQVDSSGNTATVQCAGSDTINGNSSIVLTPQNALALWVPNG